MFNDTFWKAMGAIAFATALPYMPVKEEPMGRNRRRNRKKRRRKQLRAQTEQNMPWHNRSGGAQLKVGGSRWSRHRRNKNYPKYKRHSYATLFYTAGVKDTDIEIEEG